MFVIFACTSITLSYITERYNLHVHAADFEGALAPAKCLEPFSKLTLVSTRGRAAPALTRYSVPGPRGQWRGRGGPELAKGSSVRGRPCPCNIVQQQQSFLGLESYHRRSEEGFATLVGSLHGLTHRGQLFSRIILSGCLVNSCLCSVVYCSQ